MMELRFADLDQGENFAFVGRKAQTGSWVKTGYLLYARDLSDEALQFAVESLNDEVELLDQPSVCKSERITDLPCGTHEEGQGARQNENRSARIGRRPEERGT